MDFRTYKEAVVNKVAEMNERDNNWRWSCKVLKNEIRVYWGYLKYLEEMTPYFTINFQGDDILRAYDENGTKLEIALIDEEYGDGNDLECTMYLLNSIERATNRY